MKELIKEMWLPATISLLYVGEAAWRLVIMPPNNTVERTYLIFNAVNLLLFAVMGFGCLGSLVIWPEPKSSSRSQAQKTKKAEEEMVAVVVETSKEEAIKGKEVVEVVDSKNPLRTDDSAGGDPPAPSQDMDKPEKPPAKRQLVYLTNLKAFLTFQVVMIHTLCQFTSKCTDGIGTVSFDPQNPFQGPKRPFTVFGLFLIDVNQEYFMSAFYLISGYFCPKSLDRKGFRHFVLDKLVRLGGPFLLWSALLRPVLYIWCYAYVGYSPLVYEYGEGPPWFILWLLNFSLLYALVAQILPTMHFKMPHPLLLLVLGLGLGGVFYGIKISIGQYMMLGGMNQWTYGLAIYVPFFTAGVAGGRNNWLTNIEEMKPWVFWSLRVFVAGIWLISFLEILAFTFSISSIKINPELNELKIPMYAVAMTLVMMQLFYKYFNSYFNSKILMSMGTAAYTVYIIHPWVLNVVMLMYVEILKAAKVPIFWMEKYTMVFLTEDDSGQPDLLPDGYLWGGWIFVFVLTQLFVWPLAHYFRKLPIMNKML